LLLEGQDNVWALDVNTILDFTLALVCLGAQRNEEAQCLISRKVKEDIETLNKLLIESPDVRELKGVVKSPVLAIAEIKVNHERLGSGRRRLLNDIHGSATVSEEVIVQQLKKLTVI
jgi:hypothetical protein